MTPDVVVGYARSMKITEMRDVIRGAACAFVAAGCVWAFDVASPAARRRNGGAAAMPVPAGVRSGELPNGARCSPTLGHDAVHLPERYAAAVKLQRRMRDAVAAGRGHRSGLRGTPVRTVVTRPNQPVEAVGLPGRPALRLDRGSTARDRAGWVPRTAPGRLPSSTRGRPNRRSMSSRGDLPGHAEPARAPRHRARRGEDCGAARGAGGEEPRQQPGRDEDAAARRRRQCCGPRRRTDRSRPRLRRQARGSQRRRAHSIGGQGAERAGDNDSRWPPTCSHGGQHPAEV